MREMKNSGIDKLGMIPNRWEVAKLKYICSSKVTNIQTETLNKEKGLFKVFGAAGLMGYCDFETMEKDYIGIVKDGAGAGRLDFYPAHSSLLGTMAYIIPNETTNLRWLMYVVQSLNLGDSIDKTTIPHIYFSEYGNEFVCFPTLEEQSRIANFLDKKVAAIDNVIAKTKESIEEYKKLKQSIITEAVTKGLNPDVEMKDSGLSDLLLLPINWKTSRIKNKFVSGKGLPITKDNLIDGGLPVVSYGQIHSKTNDGVSVKNELKRYVSFDYAETNPSCEVKKGDFIFADTSEDYDGCGNCVYKREDGPLFAGYHCIILKSKEIHDNRYFAYLFQTDVWRKQLREVATGVKLFSIAQKTLMSSWLIVPPITEQVEIANYLDNKLREYDKLIFNSNDVIDELEQYKKSLIYEYVTGKKEVPNE